MPHYKHYIVYDSTDYEFEPLNGFKISVSESENAYKKEVGTVLVGAGAAYDVLNSISQQAEFYIKAVRQSDSEIMYLGLGKIKKRDYKTKVIEVEASEDAMGIQQVENASVEINALENTKANLTYLVKTASATTISGWTKFAAAVSYLGTDYDVFVAVLTQYNVGGFESWVPGGSTAYYVKEYDYSVSPVFVLQASSTPPSGYTYITPLETSIPSTYFFQQTSTIQQPAESVVDVDIYSKITNYDFIPAATNKLITFTDYTSLINPGDTFKAVLTDGNTVTSLIFDIQADYIQLVDNVLTTSIASAYYFVSSTSYDNGRLFKIVLAKALYEVNPNLAVRSAFLFGDDVETGNTWTIAEIDGYTLGTLQIHQASDLFNPTASEPATVGRITLQAILNTLKLLRVYWFIDVDGYFRIEHISYRRFSGTNDMRTVYSQGVGANKIPVCDELQVISYNSTGDNGRIDFQPVAYSQPAFGARYLEYVGADTSKADKLSADSLIFDYQAATQQKEQIPITSLVLIPVDGSGLATEALSFDNIVPALWRHESNYDQFLFNGTTYDAESLVYNREVESINYPEAMLAFEPLKLYQTYLDSGASLGKVRTAEINTISGNVLLGLVFERE